jgi:hypothetical protein
MSFRVLAVDNPGIKASSRGKLGSFHEIRKRNRDFYLFKKEIIRPVGTDEQGGNPEQLP